jgi:hypothetical protein
MKIRPVGAELFHADGRTDTTKLIVAFRNFGNASNKRTHRRNDSLQSKRKKLRDCDGKLQSIFFDSKIFRPILHDRLQNNTTRWIILREFFTVRFTENPAIRRFILQRY